MSVDVIARLKITLDGVKPVVLRRVEVPVTIRLHRLHLVIQAAMGWSNSHLYEIRVGDLRWSDPGPDWGPDGPLDAGKFRLERVLWDARAEVFRYLYDFGDGWEHTIKRERFADAVPATLYPRLLNATGNCPPEDSGGPWGYGEFLEAIGDPDHEDHDDVRTWIGGDFDPAHVDFAALEQDVAALAKQWSPKPAAKRKRRD